MLVLANLVRHMNTKLLYDNTNAAPKQLCINVQYVDASATLIRAESASLSADELHYFVTDVLDIRVYNAPLSPHKYVLLL
jgi:hypothetical protein